MFRDLRVPRFRSYTTQSRQTYTFWGGKNKVTEDKEAREQPVGHDR